jgi:hypothetical protein
MSKTKFTVVVVEKTGKLKETSLSFTDKYNIHDTQYIYNFDTEDGKMFKVAIYAKTEGKAGQENKYEFPPPFDKHLFFDKCILIKYNEVLTPTSLTVGEWNRLYNTLHGGFEDLGEEDEEEAFEIEEEERMLKNPNIKFTKEGYLKDDMFVDDNDDMETFNIEGDDDEEYEPVAKKKKSKAEKKPKKKTGKKAQTETETHAQTETQPSQEDSISQSKVTDPPKKSKRTKKTAQPQTETETQTETQEHPLTIVEPQAQSATVDPPKKPKRTKKTAQTETQTETLAQTETQPSQEDSISLSKVTDPPKKSKRTKKTAQPQQETPAQTETQEQSISVVDSQPSQEDSIAQSATVEPPKKSKRTKKTAQPLPVQVVEPVPPTPQEDSIEQSTTEKPKKSKKTTKPKETSEEPPKEPKTNKKQKKTEATASNKASAVVSQTLTCENELTEESYSS